jgi:Sec-independent protein translocase protein TatA
MFGFSLAELILVLVVAIIFIKPADLPEIARFVGKAIFHGKRLYGEAKKHLRDLEKDFEIDQLKQEVNMAINEEKLKFEPEEDETIIVDIYGNEHRVNNVASLRPDLKPEELSQEIAKNNQENQQKLNSNNL